MSEVDLVAVNKYFDGVNSSILGPYMMDGYGFPNGAGDFRFRSEIIAVERLLGNLCDRDFVLDLGSGSGFWAEHFSQGFSAVVAVEGSHSLYNELKNRTDPYSNVEALHSNVLDFEPKIDFNLAFLGGLLMYLDEKDVVILLKNLARHLAPGGMVLCRESTVRGQTVSLTGPYSVVYRSVESYQRIFETSGLSLTKFERNEAYILPQMGCELVDKWTAWAPKKLQMVPTIGRLIYWALRVSNPWITKIPKALGRSFPMLENHFFVLEANV
jgi:SAM-dependent methyltransferase